MDQQVFGSMDQLVKNCKKLAEYTVDDQGNYAKGLYNVYLEGTGNSKYTLYLQGCDSGNLDSKNESEYIFTTQDKFIEEWRVRSNYVDCTTREGSTEEIQNFEFSAFGYFYEITDTGKPVCHGDCFVNRNPDSTENDSVVEVYTYFSDPVLFKITKIIVDFPSQSVCEYRYSQKSMNLYMEKSNNLALDSFKTKKSSFDHFVFDEDPCSVYLFEGEIDRNYLVSKRGPLIKDPDIYGWDVYTGNCLIKTHRGSHGEFTITIDDYQKHRSYTGDHDSIGFEYNIDIEILEYKETVTSSCNIYKLLQPQDDLKDFFTVL